MPSTEPASLLQLPDTALVAVLQCCADDQRSLFSAARAHSRLHQTAVQALSSVVSVVSQQQQQDSLLLYLGKHGRHVSSIELRAVQPVWPVTWRVTLRQLPPNLQLSSL